MDEKDKITALSFDEVYIAHDICFDKAIEKVIGPHKTVQVIMARGLIAKWKQPIFYAYDTPMTKLILEEIISKLHCSGYNVVSVTSDMGTGNVGLWKSMEISHDNPSFSHPITGRAVHVFADVPHLIKLLRNHFIDHGFLLDKSKLIQN